MPWANRHYECLPPGEHYLDEVWSESVESSCSDDHRDTLDNRNEQCWYGENLYEGYPQWELSSDWPWKQTREDWQTTVAKVLKSLGSGEGSRRLELWFPDPQRYIVGVRSLVQGGPISKALRQLVGISELIVHGVQELGATEATAEVMKVSKVTARLSRSRVRPHIHVEAGRPDLMIYSSWRLIFSTWKRIEFQLIAPRRPTKDIFSNLPSEIHRQIFSYCFFPTENCSMLSLNPFSGDLHYPQKVFQNYFFGDEIYWTSHLGIDIESSDLYIARTILGTSRLFYS